MSGPTQPETGTPRPGVAPTGPARRTIVAAGAWSSPVVAAALAGPLAAASTAARALVFESPSYDIARASLGGVAVRLTVGGTAAGAGIPVVFSLPDGARWTDFSRVDKTLLTDRDGRIVLAGDDAVTTDPPSEITAGAVLRASAVGYPVATAGLLPVAEGTRRSIAVFAPETDGYPLSGWTEFRVVLVDDAGTSAPAGTPIEFVPEAPGAEWSGGGHEPRTFTMPEDGLGEGGGTGYILVGVEVPVTINRSGTVRASSPGWGSMSCSFEPRGFGRIWFEPGAVAAPVGELLPPMFVLTDDGYGHETSGTVVVELPEGFEWAVGAPGPRELIGGMTLEGDDAIRAAAVPGGGAITATGPQLEDGSGSVEATAGGRVLLRPGAGTAATPGGSWPGIMLSVVDAYNRSVATDVTLTAPASVSLGGVPGGSTVVPTFDWEIQVEGLVAGTALGEAGELIAAAPGFASAALPLSVALGSLSVSTYEPYAIVGSAFPTIAISTRTPGGDLDLTSGPITVALSGGPRWATGGPATRVLSAVDGWLLLTGDDEVSAAPTVGTGTLTASGAGFAEAVTVDLPTRARGSIRILPRVDTVAAGQMYPAIVVELRDAAGALTTERSLISVTPSGGLEQYWGDQDPNESWEMGRIVLSQYRGYRAAAAGGDGLLTIAGPDFTTATHTFHTL